MRKFWFAYLAKALIVFPGGFGTLDEMFEILTLGQTRKLSKKLLVLLYGSESWNAVIDFQPLVEWGAVNEKDVDLLCRVDSPTEAFEELKTFLMANHMVPATPQTARQESQKPGDPRVSSRIARRGPRPSGQAGAIRPSRAGAACGTPVPPVPTMVRGRPRHRRGRLSSLIGAVQHIDRLLVVFVLVRQLLPGETRGILPPELRNHFDGGPHGLECGSIRRVRLAPAARLARVLVEGQLEHRPEVRPAIPPRSSRPPGAHRRSTGRPPSSMAWSSPPSDSIVPSNITAPGYTIAVSSVGRLGNVSPGSPV